MEGETLTLEKAAILFLDDRRLKGRSAKTIARYRAALTAWGRWRERQGHTPDLRLLQPAELRHYLLFLLLEHIPHADNPTRPPAQRIGLSPNAVRSARNIIRALLLFLVDERQLSPEWRELLKNSRMPAPQVTLTDREYWDEATVDALCAAAAEREPEVAARTVAMIRLIHESGMRLEEICDLLDADLDVANGRARITGKGRKKRWVYWGDDGAAALDAYLAVRRGETGGPVFRCTDYRNDGGALPPGSVRALIKRLAKRKGIALPAGAPIHAGRHGFAHLMIDGGAAISEVCDLMGHSDVRTTMRYLHERPEKLQATHAQALKRAKHKPDPEPT